jgi:pyridoxine kinase
MSPSTLVVEDFSALGQISMLAALNILQAFDIETAALPTTLLSTQTEGFNTPVRLDTQEWMQATSKHWQSIPDLQLHGALVGYLGSVNLMQPVGRLLKKASSPILIDPVMADRGALYPGLDPDYPAHMRQFCQSADVITPNWAELCLLAGYQKPIKVDLDHFKRLLGNLQDQGIHALVVTTGVAVEQKETTLAYDGHEINSFVSKRYPGHFYGAGDTFAALLLGNLLTGQELFSAVKTSCQQLSQAIQETSTYPATERRYGLKLRNLLHLISNS